MTRSISDSVSALRSSLDDITTALTERSVEVVGNLKVSQVADYIRQIKGGSRDPSNDNKVICFVDPNYHFKKDGDGITILNFTNKKATVSTEDISYSKDKSVVTWTEGTTRYVSTQDETKSIGFLSFKTPFNGSSSSEIDEKPPEFVSTFVDGYNIYTEGTYIFYWDNFTQIILDNIDTSKTENFDYMFSWVDSEVVYFDRINTKNATSMSHFLDSARLDGVEDITFIQTSKVKDMSYMFSGNYDLFENFDFMDFSSVENLAGFFYDCDLPISDLSFIDFSKLTNVKEMFSYSTMPITELDFGTSKITDMSGLFLWAKLPLMHLNIDTSRATDMSDMFKGCTLQISDIDFDLSYVTTTSSMFEGASLPNVKNINLRNTSRLKDISSMFSGFNFTDKNLIFDTSSVENFNSVFRSNSTLPNNLSSWNTKNATSFALMFRDTKIEGEINLNNFNTSKVTDFHSCFMFSQFSKIDIWDWSFTTSGEIDVSEMFDGAKNLKTVYMKELDEYTNIKFSYDMFDGTKLPSISSSTRGTSVSRACWYGFPDYNCCLYKKS